MFWGIQVLMSCACASFSVILNKQQLQLADCHVHVLRFKLYKVSVFHTIFKSMNNSVIDLSDCFKSHKCKQDLYRQNNTANNFDRAFYLLYFY